MGNQIIEKIKQTEKWKVIIFILLSLALIGSVVIYSTAQNNKNYNLIVQGTIKMEEVDLNTKIPGNIEKILVAEGDDVKVGDPLVVMSSETIKAKLMQAEGAKEAAEAQANKATAGARSQEVEQAKAAYEYAQKTYDRMKILLQEEAISEATFDQVQAQFTVARETYNMALEGARAEDKAAASGLVSQASGAVAEATSYLEDSVIKAPTDGKITSINISEGELVSTGMPLATVTKFSDPWVEVNIKETDLSKVKLGQLVELKISAYPGEKFSGKVIKVSQKPDFATKRATNENGDFDVLSFGVKVKLIDIEKTIYPNMTVLVNFEKKAGK